MFGTSIFAKFFKIHIFHYIKRVENTENPVESKESLRERLTDQQYKCTQEADTEAPFTGIYWDETRDGTYRCIVCDEPLFSSESKFDSGCGWPSFDAPIQDGIITFRSDQSFGMLRTETLCTNCGAHLGHIFPDGPTPTGDRYCINSACINLETEDN